METVQDRIGKDTEQGCSPCPQPGQIAEFVLGLSEQEDEIIDHVGSCERCRLLVDVVSETIETLD